MYTPTHIQVTVQRARNLLTKGKNGTNNCFTTIALGKEKYQTTLKENASAEKIDWFEECELAIPSQGNRAELTLTVLHRNNFGIDEFLGQISLPLNEMDQFDRPKNKWYKLQSKPGQEKKKDKDRGELEVRTTFTVKAGSLSDLSKKDKNKSSLSNIANNVGGSLLSLGQIEKRKSLKKFAKSLGTKMHVTGKKKKDKGEDTDSYTGSFSSLGTPNLGTRTMILRNEGNADPGVISEDEDEFAFENLSHKSSGSSLNIRQKNNNLILTKQQEDVSTPTLRESATLPQLNKPKNVNETIPTKDAKVDEWEAKLYGKNMEIGHSTDSLKRRSWENSRIPFNNNTEHEAKEKEREPTIQEQSMERVSLEFASTAPASPVLDKIEKQSPKPLPLPRAATAAEPIVSLTNKSNDDEDNLHSKNKNNTSPVSFKSEKGEKENIFSKKWKNFRKEHTPHRNDNETIKNHYNKPSTGNGGERIIIGGENAFNSQSYIEKKIDLPKEVLAKYDGKSKEEIMKIAHNLEGDLIQQKQKNKELEEYLDILLLKVMETHPRLLQNPYYKQSG